MIEIKISQEISDYILKYYIEECTLINLLKSIAREKKHGIEYNEKYFNKIMKEMIEASTTKHLIIKEVIENNTDNIPLNYDSIIDFINNKIQIKEKKVINKCQK